MASCSLASMASASASRAESSCSRVYSPWLEPAPLPTSARVNASRADSNVRITSLSGERPDIAHPSSLFRNSMIR